MPKPTYHLISLGALYCVKSPLASLLRGEDDANPAQPLAIDITDHHRVLLDASLLTLESPAAQYQLLHPAQNRDIFSALLLREAHFQAALLFTGGQGLHPAVNAQLTCAVRSGLTAVVTLLLTKENDDADLIDLAELELRETFSSLGLPGDEAPIIRSRLSALLANLLALFDQRLPLLVKKEAPLDPHPPQTMLAVIEEVNRGNRFAPLFLCYMRQGELSLYDTVKLVSAGTETTAQVTLLGYPTDEAGYEKYVEPRQLLRYVYGTGQAAQAGEAFACVLSGDLPDLELAQLLLKPGGLCYHKRFLAEIYALPEAGARPYYPQIRLGFFLEGVPVGRELAMGHYHERRPPGLEGTFLLSGGVAPLPDASYQIEVTLLHGAPLWPGQRFLWVHPEAQYEVAGLGRVQKVLE